MEPIFDPLLPKEQARLQCGKSTVDQVVLLTQNIEGSFEVKKKAGAVFVGLTVAYDTVWNRALTCKLLKLLPDNYMIRMIMKLVRNRSFLLLSEIASKIISMMPFLTMTNTRPVQMDFPQAVSIELNHLHISVRRFHLSMHKWGLASSSHCQCGALEQTTDHILITCSIHRALHRAQGLTVLNNKTQCWLNTIAASICF